MTGRLLEDVELIGLNMAEGKILSRIAKKGEKVTVGFYPMRTYFVEGNRLYEVFSDDGLSANIDCGIVELTW